MNTFDAMVNTKFIQPDFLSDKVECSNLGEKHERIGENNNHDIEEPAKSKKAESSYFLVFKKRKFFNYIKKSRKGESSRRYSKVEDGTLLTASTRSSKVSVASSCAVTHIESCPFKPAPISPQPTLEPLKFANPRVDPTPWPQQTLMSCKPAQNSQPFLGDISYKYHCEEESTNHNPPTETALIEAMKASVPLFVVSQHISIRHRLDANESTCDKSSSMEKVLNDPLLIEAAESLFMPIACVAEDCSALTIYPITEGTSNVVYVHEPFDDGPCVRIMARCISRYRPVGTVYVNRELSVPSIAVSMAEALRHVGRPVPTYLEILAKEYVKRTVISDRIISYSRDLYFNLTDLNLGEAFFAAIDGVISIRSGRIDGLKTIRISYDSKRVSYSHLVQEAIDNNMVSRIYYTTNEEKIAIYTKSKTHSFQPFQVCKFSKFLEDLDSKHALRKTALRFVPLSSVQCSLANKLVLEEQTNEAMHLLSPRQGLILQRLFQTNTKALNDAVDIPIHLSWSRLIQSGFFDPK